MSFHEVRFPADLSFGAMGGPERRTDVVELSSGFEERNSPWAHSRRRYDAGLGLRGLDDIEQLLAFFEARHGQLYGFRWKDWADYRSCRPSGTVSPGDQVIANRPEIAAVVRLEELGAERGDVDVDRARRRTGLARQAAPHGVVHLVGEVLSQHRPSWTAAYSSAPIQRCIGSAPVRGGASGSRRRPRTRPEFRGSCRPSSRWR